MEYSIERFDPLNVPDHFLDQYFDLLDELHNETHPFDPFPSRDKQKKSIKNPHPNYENKHWIIRLKNKDNKIIGRGKLEYWAKSHAAYQINSHIVFGTVDIAKPYRKSGIGTECLKTLISEMQYLSKTVFQSSAILSSGLSFCSKLGGLEANKNTQTRLYFKDINWNLMKNWRDKGKERKEFSLQSCFVIPEEDLSEWACFATEVVNQGPSRNLEGQFNATPEFVRLHENRCQKNGTQWIRIYAKSNDGEIVATTDRYFNPDHPERTIVSFTGVKEKYRGQGLCKWLKSEMLFHIKHNYPSVEYEVSGTDNENAPMRSVNERMGFKPTVATVFYKFDVNNLAKRLGI